ncbi:hypothetical protein SAY87_014631 [Trapa incisa]|uniref:HMA domain-containing protein n=1 Tax=Trapa incisa TaxID=236973 RepID=A0AAN7JLB0_9MYRT|nr:hypothetical protein SAY87_014631 [Trapa incisa]
MKQKIVLKVEKHNCAKCRRKALQLSAQSYGVNFVGIDGEKIVVKGDEVDAVGLVRVLRKKVGWTDLISMGEDK